MRFITISLVLLSVFCTFVYGQKGLTTTTTSPSTKGTYQHYEKVYRESLKYSDFEVATNALYNMMAADPSNTTLKDSLVVVYLNRNAFVQCILLGRNILESNEENATIREIVAICEQTVGLSKEALENYEKLYRKSKELFHLYQIASLQYALKRFGECDMSLNAILSDDRAGTEKISISAGQNQSQNILVSSAAYNMKGVLALELNQLDNAEQLFKKALELEPDFDLAISNLQALEQQKKSGK